jgi:hypothetical protein
MKASAKNFRMVVTIWIEPMFFTPERFTSAGTQSPISTRAIEMPVRWSLLTKCST